MGHIDTHTPPHLCQPPEVTEAMEGVLPTVSLALSMLFNLSLYHHFPGTTLSLHLSLGCPQCARLSALTFSKPLCLISPEPDPIAMWQTGARTQVGGLSEVVWVILGWAQHCLSLLFPP